MTPSSAFSEISFSGRSSWTSLCADTNSPPGDPVLQRLKNLEESLESVEQSLAKNLGDLMWFRRLDDIATVDKIRYTARRHASRTIQRAGRGQ